MTINLRKDGLDVLGCVVRVLGNRAHVLRPQEALLATAHDLAGLTGFQQPLTRTRVLSGQNCVSSN